MHDQNVPWTIVPTPRRVSIQQESQASGHWRRWLVLKKGNQAFSGGALILAEMDGHNFNMPTNFDAVIRYFVW